MSVDGFIAGPMVIPKRKPKVNPHANLMFPCIFHHGKNHLFKSGLLSFLINTAYISAKITFGGLHDNII
jgi:hypothetical protein